MAPYNDLIFALRGGGGGPFKLV